VSEAQKRSAVSVNRESQLESLLWDKNELELQEVEETVSQLDFELEL